MSREFKFRIWDLIDKKYYYTDGLGGSLDEEYGNLCFALNDHPESRYSNEVVIQQYTGLKNKDGVEIYEGDLVKISYYYSHVGVVVQDVSGTWLAEENIPWKPLYEEIMHPGVKVIGNIYENSELLGEQQ